MTMLTRICCFVPVLMLLLEKTKTPDLNIPRKLMERTIRTVRIHSVGYKYGQYIYIIVF